ncbi:hypothetical protein OIU78_003881 [Salix suchowensis]|nr:hypothetical protein OIU78_003881 [Salix suchowensis]
MHCEACAQVLQKRVRKIQGVESVENRPGQRSMKDEEKKEEEKKEEKKEEKEEEKKDGEEEKAEDDKKLEIKKNEYWPSKDYSEYAYAPEIFSDENPNACSVM